MVAHQSSNVHKHGTAARTTHVHEPSIGLCAEHSDARQLGIKEASHARVVRRERRHQMHLTLAKAPSGETQYGSSISSGHPRSWCRSGKPTRSLCLNQYMFWLLLSRECIQGKDGLNLRVHISRIAGDQTGQRGDWVSMERAATGTGNHESDKQS